MKKTLSSFLVIGVLLLTACAAPAVTQTVTTTTITTPTAAPTLTVTSTTTSIITVTTTPTVTTTMPIAPTTSTPPITTTPTTTTTPPTTTAFDLSNVALAGTSGGFNIVDENGISVLNEELGQVNDIAVDEQGLIWAVTSGGLKVFDGQSWTDCQQPQGVYTLYAIAIDSAGRVWLGYYGGVSILLDGGQWLNYSSGDFGLGQYANLVNDVAVDHQDQVWVATPSGVAVFNGDSWTPYDETSGLTYNTIEAIVVDHQGEVWVAHSYGVDVFDGSNWIFYGEKYDKTPQIEVEELSGVKALAVDNQGFVWAGTSGYGVSVFDGSDWQTYDSRECFYGSSVNSIACDSRDRVWLGTDFGLTVFDGSNWSQYTKNTSEILSNDIETIVVTGAGPSLLPPAPAIEPGDLRGKVLSGGQPVAGATVVLCWQTVPFYSGESPCSGDLYSAVTDENGDFYITGVPPYKYCLAIQKPDGDWKILIGYTYVIDGETTNVGNLSI
ncbi:hypothetical protein ACFLY3_04205 [Chloroflexota bacterium]